MGIKVSETGLFLIVSVTSPRILYRSIHEHVQEYDVLQYCIIIFVHYDIWFRASRISIDVPVFLL